jgi:hypothetical protein
MMCYASEMRFPYTAFVEKIVYGFGFGSGMASAFYLLGHAPNKKVSNLNVQHYVMDVGIAAPPVVDVSPTTAFMSAVIKCCEH